MSDPSFTPSAIYFDTEPLLGAGWPTPSAQLLQMMSQADKLRFRLCLPDVVTQELEGHWIRELVEEWDRANAQIGSLNRKARSVVKFTTLPALPANDELRATLRKLVNDFNARFRIVPTTKRPLEEFVGLAIRRGATFKDKGHGFQDSVILCSVVDDMIANGFVNAFLVTHDGMFKSSGAADIARAASVTLKVVSTLDELEGLLREHLSAIVRAHYEKENTQLMEALNAQRHDLEDYLVKNLTVTSSELGVWQTIRKIESLHVVLIENVHSTIGMDEDDKSEDSNEVKVSVDVKVGLTLDILEYSPPDPARLKVGEEVVPAPNPVPSRAEFFLLHGKYREVIVVVEGIAAKTENGYSRIQFTSARLKQDDYYSYHSLPTYTR